MQKLLVIVFGMLALVSLSVAQAGPLDPHTIVVSGHSEILVSPDHATIDIGVITSDKMTTKALQANSVEMQHVVTAIKMLGIPEDAMQTSEFSISALHPQAKDAYGREDESITLGYQVANKVTVSVTDLNKVADIVDAAVNAGANSSNSVDFDVKNRAAFDDQVLAAAVRDARHNAEIMASAENARVGKMISITNVPSMAAMGFDYAPRAMAIIARKIPPILPGNLTLRATVAVTYAVE